MSRERPIEPPRVVPDTQRGIKHETPSQIHAREELERLKNLQGPGIFGAFASFFQDHMPRVRFIRRGYEANIVDELRDFYARRPRPWRQKHRQAGATHKERLKAKRRAKPRWRYVTSAKAAKRADWAVNSCTMNAALLNAEARVIVEQAGPEEL